MDANGHAALAHVLHDATSSVVEQLRAQLQEKERELAQADRRLAQATARTAAIHLHCRSQVSRRFLQAEEWCDDIKSWVRRMNVTKKWYRIPIPYVSIAYMLHGYEYVKYYVHEKEWFDDMQEDEPEFESTTWSEHWPEFEPDLIPQAPD